jgi:stress-induced morphogen
MIYTNESKQPQQQGQKRIQQQKTTNQTLSKLCGFALEYHGLKLDTFNGQQEVLSNLSQI